MGSSTEATVLAALERAELAARELRLAASTEAERIVASARDRAASVSETADARIAEALDLLRVQAGSEADLTIDALERAAGHRVGDASGAWGHDPAFDRAVDMVVGLILGEGPA